MARARISRRLAIQSLAALIGGAAVGNGARSAGAVTRRHPKWDTAIDKGLNWLIGNQSTLGHWTGAYPTAMTALSATALVASGATTTQGPYAKQIRKSVDYLTSKARTNGLIGDPLTDNRYTYGHGFSMLVLSQILGEEEDAERRQELIEVLKKAVEFCGNAQTQKGGWGYVSARDGNNFDEGSTTITQVQGLRGCRNAGISVPIEIIEKAKKYIYDCKNDDGGISYSSRNLRTSRPAITAAALAALYNAGDYDSQHVPAMLKYCKDNLSNINAGGQQAFGHWHYTYLYYSQVMYRQGSQDWEPFRDKLYDRIVSEQAADGSWNGNMGQVYVSACNLIMLQLDRGCLPIYQR